MGGVGGVHAWVTLLACLCGWCAIMGRIVAWVGCLHLQHGLGGWHANVVGMSIVLTYVACYYCCCYYWNTIIKEKMLNVYLWNKNKKMFEIDLNSNLKEEPDLKDRCCFTLFEMVMPGYIPYLYIYNKYALICVTLWICLNMHETLCA